MAEHPDIEFIKFIVNALTDDPVPGEEYGFETERRIDEKGVLIILTIDQPIAGRILGKGGATAQSIRTLLRALGSKNDARYNLKIEVRQPHSEAAA